MGGAATRSGGDKWVFQPPQSLHHLKDLLASQGIHKGGGSQG